MRNVSDTGAKLVFDNVGLVPRVSMLFVELMATRYNAKGSGRKGKGMRRPLIGQKQETRIRKTQIVESSEKRP
ncbi:MAG: hypothetical protein R3D29_04990 [Nitratireductor sp.]